MAKKKEKCNPNTVEISAYKKLDNGSYEIHFHKCITSMSLYELKKKK